jgi:hypothetical protein
MTGDIVRSLLRDTLVRLLAGTEHWIRFGSGAAIGIMHV